MNQATSWVFYKRSPHDSYADTATILQCMPGCVTPFSETSLAKTGILSARLIRSHNVCIVNMEAVCFQYRRCNLWLYSLIPMQDSIGRDRNKVTMSECHYNKQHLLLKSTAVCNKFFLYWGWNLNLLYVFHCSLHSLWSFSLACSLKGPSDDLFFLQNCNTRHLDTRLSRTMITETTC